MPRGRSRRTGDECPGVDPANSRHPDEVTASTSRPGASSSMACITSAAARREPALTRSATARPAILFARQIHLCERCVDASREDCIPGTRNLQVGKITFQNARTTARGPATTLEHLLDMTSGVYGSVTENADENSADAVQKFFVPESHRQKIDYACNFSHRRGRPGRISCIEPSIRTSSAPH